MTKIIFVLLYSITSGGSTVEGQVQHDFATKKECLAERKKLIEGFHGRPGDSITAHCEQVKE